MLTSRQCWPCVNAVFTMLPGGNAVIATMLTMGQCRLYDAARRQCCPRDNADPTVDGIPAHMTQVGQHIFLLYVDACIRLFISHQRNCQTSLYQKRSLIILVTQWTSITKNGVAPRTGVLRNNVVVVFVSLAQHPLQHLNKLHWFHSSSAKVFGTTFRGESNNATSTNRCSMKLITNQQWKDWKKET